MEPAVEAMSTPVRLRLPRPTSNPASGRMSSDGIGGKTCSTAMITTSAGVAELRQQVACHVTDSREHGTQGGARS